MTLTQYDHVDNSSHKKNTGWKGRLSRTPRQQRTSTLEQVQAVSRESDLCSITSDNSIVSKESSETDELSHHDSDKNTLSKDTSLHETKCALQKEVAIQGRLFITKDFVCFKSTLAGQTYLLEFKVQDIQHIERVRVKRWMPRVIHITLNNSQKHVFTSFSSSLSSRDEVYYRLCDIHKENPPSSFAPSKSSLAKQPASSSTTTRIMAALPSPTFSSSTTTSSKSISDTSNSNTLPLNEERGQYDTMSSTIDIATHYDATVTSHFKLFGRRRAHTVSTQSQPSSRARSTTSSSAHDVKNSHVSWEDRSLGQFAASSSSSSASSPSSSSCDKSLSSKPKVITTTSSSPVVINQRKTIQQSRVTTSPSISEDIYSRRLNVCINVKTICIVGGFLLFLSHSFLTYRFYHVTQLFNNQHNNEHRPGGLNEARLSHSDATWLSNQLKEVKDQAQLWEKETMRQRRRLLDLIPS